MPLKLASAGVCTGPKEGPQGQRGAGVGGEAAMLWAGQEGTLLLPPSLSFLLWGWAWAGHAGCIGTPQFQPPAVTPSPRQPSRLAREHPLKLSCTNLRLLGDFLLLQVAAGML